MTALIDINQLKSKKARESKELEVQRYSQAITVLKKKLAKQIINNAADVKAFKEMTLEDLLNFTNEYEA